MSMFELSHFRQKTNEIAIIVGSHRLNSQSRKVGEYIQHLLHTELDTRATWILDLAEKLPMWDEEVWESGGKWDELWTPISTRLHNACGLVVIAPEWSGMATPALKNFFLLCSNHELAHKPGMIVSVSSGDGGSYPVAELRMSSHKNTRICYIPDHVIVRNVEALLNDHAEAQNEDDQRLRERLKYALQVFNVYAQALTAVRIHPSVDLSRYQYGM